MSSLIKWHKGGLKNPLARARGLGSAKRGADHWLAERVSSVAMVVLGLWFICAVITNHHMTFTEALLWLSSPFNAVMMILLVIVSVHHAVMGVQVVVEDYVHNEGLKIVTLVLMKLFYYGLAVLGVFSILQIAL